MKKELIYCTNIDNLILYAFCSLELYIDLFDINAVVILKLCDMIATI